MAGIYISHLLTDEEMRTIVRETHAGVESIDFSMASCLDTLQKSIENYRRRLEFMETSDLTIHGPFLDLNPVSYDQKIMDVTEYRFAQAYEAAVELGAKKIVYHSGFYPQIYYLIGWADRMADFFHRFLEERKEIPVAVENVYDTTWEGLLDMKEQMTEDNFQLCLDMGHANCFSSIPAEIWAEKLSRGIGHVHVHDNGGDKDAHLALGQGNIAVAQVFDIVEKIPGCTYTIECNTLEDAKASWDMLMQRKQNKTGVFNPN